MQLHRVVCTQPLIGNSTILDLSMPGAHDTVTYDLSTSLSDGYEGMPDAISKILHALTPLVARPSGRALLGPGRASHAMPARDAG